MGPRMLYPLKFKPRLVEKMWGGRRLSALGKPLPPGKLIGESWELYDFPAGVIEDRAISSEVANGSLAGRTLRSLIAEFGRDLHGDVPLISPHGQFPLLIKYLDARENLSVQVHPDLAYTQHHPGTHLKTEAWYVVENDPGARLYKGLRPGTTRQVLEQAVRDGRISDLINAVPVKPGQCFYLPSGTVHALGAGILVAEVQTPSDTTFRVYDFDRIDPLTGKPRKLHVREALDCIDFNHAEQRVQKRAHVAGYFTAVTQLVSCPYFKIEKVRFSEGVEQAIPYDQPVVWMMLEGRAEIRVNGMDEAVAMSKGNTVLLPAKMNGPIIKTLSDCVWLEVTVPTKASE